MAKNIADPIPGDTEEKRKRIENLKKGPGGRPRSYNYLRMMSREFLDQPAYDDNGVPITFAGNQLTYLENIMRTWAQDPRRMRDLVEAAYGKPPDSPPEEETPAVPSFVTIPADLIASSFLDPFRDIKSGAHTEYVFYGGRGSTKSSFISLAMIYLLVNNPDMHGLAMRHVASTLRDSVFSQIQWAINELGLYDKFKFTYNPLEMVY